MFVNVNDTENSATVLFRVTITAGNDALTLSPIDDITVEENAGQIYVPLLTGNKNISKKL